MRTIIIILLLSNSVFASKNIMLMKCLGKEEKSLHTSKRANGLYGLNQQVISSMIQLNANIVLKTKYFKQICKKKNHSPSFELLKVVLTKKETAFTNLLKKKSMMYPVAEKSTQELYHSMINVFLTYLAKLRANAPDKDCISDHIKPLKALYTNLQYLQKDMSTQEIIETVVDLNGLFIKLEYVESIYKKCRAKAKKQ